MSEAYEETGFDRVLDEMSGEYRCTIPPYDVPPGDEDPEEVDIDGTLVDINRHLEAREIDQAITDLLAVIGDTVLTHEQSAEYRETIGHLVRARRALRKAFDIATVGRARDVGRKR